MHRARLLLISAIFVIALLIPYSQPAVAQEAVDPQTVVSEEQMRSFAKVYVQIDKINSLYEPQVREAKDHEEAAAIEKEAISKMQMALANEGLTEESYIKIFEKARADENLRQKLIELIKAEAQKQ